MLDQYIDTASRIALSYLWLIAPAVALIALLISRRVWGGWPELARGPHAVLPTVDRLAGSADVLFQLLEVAPIGVDVAGGRQPFTCCSATSIRRSRKSRSSAYR